MSNSVKTRTNAFTCRLKRGGLRLYLLWEQIRSELKKESEELGITYCELGYDGCWRTNELRFAHTLKRHNITTEEELREVFLACNSCHDKVEMLGEEKMCLILRQVIAARRDTF